MVTTGSWLAEGNVIVMPSADWFTVAVPPVSTSFPVIWRPSASAGRLKVSPGQVSTWRKMEFPLAMLPPQSAAMKGPARPPSSVWPYWVNQVPVTGEAVAAGMAVCASRVPGRPSR